jgi:hypothetical protein
VIEVAEVVEVVEVAEVAGGVEGARSRTAGTTTNLLGCTTGNRNRAFDSDIHI